ncbi:MAG TPA: nucleoside monophosphate kinase [Phycisphaerae bacterium]|nr:nucleoside monophosphate kinase [Phycisphaerae bacterium]
MIRHRAILLIGPTGAGKTPLGDLLEARGLWGRRCRHFDFGRQLRAAAAAETPPAHLTDADVEAIRGALAGALLADEQFPIAARILRVFLAGCDVGPDDWIVLNGLPRHIGQARDLAPLVDVRAVVELACSADVVLRRVRTDAGGDRAGRPDDQAAAVRERFRTYAQRTAPLVDHYRRLGARIHTIEVGPATSADDILTALATGPPTTQGTADA